LKGDRERGRRGEGRQELREGGKGGRGDELGL
jgi:hypothetical protein